MSGGASGVWEADLHPISSTDSSTRATTRTTTTLPSSSVPARKLRISYHPAQVNRPEVWRLVDGRYLACLADGTETLYDSWCSFTMEYRVYDVQQESSSDPIREVDVPAVVRHHACAINWTAIHAAAWRVDQARRPLPEIGRLHGGGDVFGGMYNAIAHNTFADLVGLVRATHTIAAHAWQIVHNARNVQGGIARARVACATAIEVSRLYAVLFEAGLIDDPSQMICGTGEGYGLSGLRWLAGEARERQPITSAEVEHFVADGTLPGTGADSALHAAGA